MSNATVKKTALVATVAVAAPATFIGGPACTYGQLWAFVNTHAAGNLHNVQVVPLPNVNLSAAQPVPFGYGGKVGGVRHQIQSWLLGGVKGNHSVAAILGAAAPLGHSTKKPNCLLAMLQGGYSPSSQTWGTPYVKLVVAAKYPGQATA